MTMVTVTSDYGSSYDPFGEQISLAWKWRDQSRISRYEHQYKALILAHEIGHIYTHDNSHIAGHLINGNLYREDVFIKECKVNIFAITHVDRSQVSGAVIRCFLGSYFHNLPEDLKDKWRPVYEAIITLAKERRKGNI